MTRGQWLVGILIVEYVALSLVFWSTGDWRRGMYWLFAAGLSAVVTF